MGDCQDRRRDEKEEFKDLGAEGLNEGYINEYK